MSPARARSSSLAGPRRGPGVLARAALLALAVGLAPGLERPASAAAASAATARATPVALERIDLLERAGEARPGETARQLESLAEQSDLLPADRLEALAALGMLYAQCGERIAVGQVADRLENWPEGDERAPARLASRLLRSAEHRAAGEVGPAGRLLAEAERLLAPDTPPRLRLRVLSERAGTETDTGRVELAVRAHHAALSLANELQLWPQTVTLLGQLAYTYAEAGQYDRADALLAEAFTVVGTRDDDSLRAYLHNLRSIVLDGRGDRAGERAETLEAIRYATRAGNLRRQATMLGNLADSYLKTREYATALRYAQQALPLAREVRHVKAEGVAQGNAGLALIALGRVDEGHRMLEEVIAASRRREEWPAVAQYEKELGQALESAGDARGAVEAYHRARRVADDIWRREQQQALVELQARYDDERRQRDMQTLDADNRLKTQQLQRRDLEQRIWWLLGFAALAAVALVGLGVRRVRRTHASLSIANAQLLAQSECDPLTGLANRRHVQAALPARSAHGALQATVFLIDVDHFKHVNDRHGHAGGDAVLQALGQRMRQALRDGDLVARWGGEEFVVVVRQNDAVPAERLARRLLGAIGAEPVDHEGRPIAVTGSIGYAVFPMSDPGVFAPGWERAIELADAAMFQAKARGRNRACGVRLRRVPDAVAFDAVCKDFDAALADGRAAVDDILGPRPASSEAAAPAPSASVHRLRPMGEAA